MSFPRLVEPEWLDVLPPEDPSARRSRRDLRRVNRMMFNDLYMACWLRRVCGGTPPRVLAELGAGDATFMLRVARRLVREWPGVRVLLLDRQNIVAADTLAAFRDLGWHPEVVTADVMHWAQAGSDPIDLVMANLFLHHFGDDELRRLFAQLARRTRYLVATEPRRARLAWYGSHLLGLLGCNRVTRHDAAISVRAGFNGDELSALWLPFGWRLQELSLPPFSHGFIAARDG
jgi:hypothetical protein